jgi:hypothetical protein
MDPDSNRIVDPYPDQESRSRKAKMTHKRIQFLEILCFEVLDVLF